jgi:putative ABC transport system permease protein
VESVGLANCAPLAGGCSSTGIRLRDRPPAPPGTEPDVGLHWVTPGWFATARVPLRSGRLFTNADRPDRQKVVVVNETAARAFWPGQNPIGRPVSLGMGFRLKDTAYVVGVVADVRYESVRVPPKPAVYLSYFQTPMSGVLLFVRTAADPLGLVPGVRRTLHELAPEVPTYDVRTMEARVADSLAAVRFNTLLLVLFGVVALSLATIGTYGVVSFFVAQRTREIGIRIALGASRRQVVRVVVGQGALLAIIGTIFGLGGALATTRVLRALLYGVEPSDPTTVVGIAALLASVVLVASWFPAHRAASVDPTVALRQ